MMLWFLPLLTFIAGESTCVAVAGSHVLANDVANLQADFAAIPPDTVLAPAPLPGSKRIFNKHELLVILHRYGLAVPPDRVSDICVGRSARPLDAEAVREALTAGLGRADAKIDLIDFTQQDLPLGRLQFQTGGLGRPPITDPNAPVMWLGRLFYDDQHSLVVWAKVKISVTAPVVRALCDLSPGNPVSAEQVELANVQLNPFTAEQAAAIALDEVVGAIPVHTVHQGEIVLRRSLRQRYAVLKGDTVSVRVATGPAHIGLEATAISSGHIGDKVLLQNPMNGHTFRAIVDGKASAIAGTGGAR